MEQSFIETISPYLELIYTISTFIIAIAAIIALKQIRIGKETLTIQSKRDALKLTAAQCDYYFNSIIPLIDKFDNERKRINDKFFKGWEATIENNNISLKNNGNMEKKIFSKDLLDPIGNLCNSLESFSVYFTSSVGDELVAYNSIGKEFIETVTEIMWWLLICREEGYYKNIISLYIIWKSRYDANELLKDKNTIEEKLSKINKSSIKTLGDKT